LFLGWGPSGPHYPTLWGFCLQLPTFAYISQPGTKPAPERFMPPTSDYLNGKTYANPCMDSGTAFALT